MLGFVLGTGCLLGLIHVLRHGGCSHRHWAHAHHFGCHGAPFWAPRQGFGARTLLRGLFARLQTTPSQENAIIATIDELIDTGRQVHVQMRGARSDMAEALRNPSADGSALAGARAKVQTGIDTMLQVVDRAFGTVHQTLDDRQRRVLADLIESGHGFDTPWAGHPYRSWL